MKEWRITIVFILFLIFTGIIIGRLVFIQVIKGDYYKALSQGLYTSFPTAQEERGRIFFKNGESLAINLSFPLVFASPKEIVDKEKTAQSLSENLDLDLNSVLAALSQEDSFYSLIKKNLSQDEVKKINSLNLKGIYLQEERGRYYPQEELASQVVGFLNEEGEGQYGLEEFYNDTLKGSEVSKKDIVDLNLTLDYNIQFEAEELLKKAQKDLEIEKGQIVVIEPASGRVIAMANFPNFNPNKYAEYADKESLAIFKNRITQDLFEPGSVFKPITIASALEEEKITPETTYTDEGFVKIGGYTIENYDQRSYGQQTITNVLEKSINTGAVFAQRQLGQHLFLKYIEKFGLFEPSGIDIQETYSENKEIKKGREINFATASFGQGIEITPIQLVRAYCALANGGKLVNPYIIESPKDLKDIKKTEREVISPKTASQLTKMLINVVENGFAKRAKIPGYYIAGKTGTAQIAFSALGIPTRGYSEKTIQSFVGYTPAFNPRFVILVKLDNPKTKTAEYSAVPIFHDLADYIIRYWKIPPDYE